jgi:hypothetical protein
MKNLTRFGIIILLALSCSHSNPVDTQKTAPISRSSDWDLIFQMEKEHWDKDTVIANLGSPFEIINDDKIKSSYLVYLDNNLKRQKWSIGFSQSNKLSSISFFPNLSNEANFSVEKIIEKWGKECVKKLEVDNSQHFIKKKHYLDCGQNRKARLNNLDQVNGLFIEL